jgi:LuxR family glucitol operon transcriptional activator
MSEDTLKTTENAKSTIKKAREAKGWTVDSQKPLEEASKIIDPNWQKDGYFVEGIGEASWKGFLYGTRSVPANIYKAYAQILELNWDDIIEKNEPKQENSQNKLNNPEDGILNIKPSAKFPYQNLPHSSYIDFVVRHIKLTDLKQKLSLKSNISKITITGIGGVGKTSLILEAANDCLIASQEKLDENYQYDAIIFSTFKQQEITHEEIIVPSYKKELSCQQVFKDIATTFGKKELLKLDFNSCIDAIQDLLRKYKTLLIVDNLETVEDIKNIIWFLNNLPRSVKVVITSRQKTNFGITIDLYSLSLKSGLKLIKHIAELQNVNLDQKQEKDIYIISSGIPLAIVLIIGKIAYHHSAEYVIERFNCVNNHIVDYCFESSIKPLKGKSSYKLLTALALLSKINSDQAIISIANIKDKEEIEQGFTELKKLNLIQRMGNKYEILPIIRSYVLSELKKDTDWEQELRNSWVKWYQDFVQKYGGQDEKEWNNYQELEEEWENITDVISWCINQDRYDDVKYFWQQIKGYSYLRGYQSDRLTNWNSRLEWTDWLIEKAKANNDYTTASEVMFDKAWTLTLIEKPEKLNEAIKLFAKVWRMKKHHHNPMFEIDVAIDISYVRIIQQKINKAQQWLKKAKQLLIKDPATEASHSRQFIMLNFYQGWVFFEQDQYNQAKTVFEKSLDLAQQIEWKRARSLCEKWLCDVAIELQDFDSTEQKLNHNLTIAQENNDQVTIAFCYQSLAFLEKARGNIDLSKDFANQAIENFKKLGMIRAIEITQNEFLT